MILNMTSVINPIAWSFDHMGNSCLHDDELMDWPATDIEYHCRLKSPYVQISIIMYNLYSINFAKIKSHLICLIDFRKF